jgi:hypothetical protein
MLQASLGLSVAHLELQKIGESSLQAMIDQLKIK